MNRFEKVSFLQFYHDMLGEFRPTPQEINDAFDQISMPRRATPHSAGYDLVSPISFVLGPNEEIKIPTGIKCQLDNFNFLMMVPRSGLGFKYHVKLANTVGIGDGDYYDNDDNEGHYWVKLRNEGEHDLRIKAGERFCQAIICNYGITIDDRPLLDDRQGGLGST